MAGIIPRGTEQVRIQTSSPVQVESARASVSSQALGALGSGVMSFGKKLKQEEDNQANIKRKLTESEKKSSIDAESKVAYAEARNMSAADGSDLDANYKKLVTPKLDKIMSDVADDESRQILGTYVGNTQGAYAANIQIESLQRLQQSNVNKLEQNLNLRADQLRESPTEAMAISQMKIASDDINALEKSNASAEIMNKARKTGLEKLGMQWMEGLYDGGESAKALNLLKANQQDPSLVTELTTDQAVEMGLIDTREKQAMDAKGESYKQPILTSGSKAELGPEVTAIMNAMSPEQKVRQINRFEAKLKQDSGLSAASISSDVSGFMKIAVAGRKYSSDDYRALQERVSNADLPVQAQTRILYKMAAADAVNEQMQLASNTPRKDWSKLRMNMQGGIEARANELERNDPRIAGIGEDFASQGQRLAITESFDASLKNLEAQQNKDAATFTIRNNQTLGLLYKGMQDGNPDAVKKYMTEAKNYQDFLGIPEAKQRYLPIPDAQTQANMLSVADSDQVASKMTAMQEQYGQDFAKVFNEVSKEDKKLSPLMAAAYVENRTSKKDIIENVKMADEIKTRFKESDLKDLGKEVDDEVTDIVDEFEQTVVAVNDDGSAIGFSNAIKEQIALDAKRELINNPNQKASDVVEKSYQKIVSETYQIANTSRYKAMIPRNIDGNRLDVAAVENYMDVILDESSVQNMSLTVPSAYTMTHGVEARTRFNQDVSDRGIWLSNDAQDGAILVMPGRDGYVPLKDASGKQISKKYVDMVSDTGLASLKEANTGRTRKRIEDLRQQDMPGRFR